MQIIELANNLSFYAQYFRTAWKHGNHGRLKLLRAKEKKKEKKKKEKKEEKVRRA